VEILNRELMLLRRDRIYEEVLALLSQM